MSMTAVSDSIERSTLIAAPRHRVWQAIPSAQEFGRWFGADLEGQALCRASEPGAGSTARASSRCCSA
ncbi:MAG: vanillate O-demethylase oxidoreductase VanB [Ramlibacter sp.]|jgi:uncharacterized protein YndB with AHSA1/START domain|nr:hypothetical protein [Ramlibacter sp.]MDB5751493.1 vanillate O-demethylase oxidoreductase VanB [Ramlibacter sp.]